MSRSDSGPINILSLSTVYPNPEEPAHGVFVRSRLRSIGLIANLKVIAPIPFLDYSNPSRKLVGRRRFPVRDANGSPEVFYPRWIFPPFGTPVNVVCLFLRLVGMLFGLRHTFRFQVIDAHFGYPEGVTACLLAAVFRCPFTITLRGIEPTFARMWFRRMCMQWAFRRAGRIFAVSSNLRDLAISLGADPSRTKTVPNGIDGDTFRLRDKVAARRKQGVDLHSKIIVSAGELIEAKGHHHVIRALQFLRSKGIDAQLLLVGKAGRGGANYEPALRRLAVDLGCENSVHFLGQVPHDVLAELLCTADVFSLASHTEGWPNVVHEALSCGAPVVATSVGGIPDMVSADTYGYVVPVGDQPAIEVALENALHKEWDRDAIAQWGRSRSWDTVAREIVDEMHQMLEELGAGSKAQALPLTTFRTAKIGDINQRVRD